MSKKSDDQIHIFIDSNIYLSFYDFTNDELEQLKVLHTNKRIKLYMPSLVIDEVWRNRANKIEESLKKLKDKKFPPYPHYCKGYDVFTALQNAQKEYETHWNTILEAITKDYLEEKLPADKTLNSLFGKVDKIKVTDEIISRAQRRQNLGNPPGKKSNLGDAINWECLLEQAPQNTNFVIITRDSDYHSPQKVTKKESEILNSFLKKEWKKEKGTEPIIFETLTKFSEYDDTIIKIDIPSEEESRKAELIEKLLNSNSFAETHNIIEKLSEYDSFTDDEKKRLIQAHHSNNQVKWIEEDEGVKAFYTEKLEVFEKP